MAALQGSGFVSVWESYAQDGSRLGIIGQRFSDSGTKLGTEFRVKTTTAGNQFAPDVVALKNGGFVVSRGGFSTYADLTLAQVYSASGVRVGGQIELVDDADINIGRENPLTTIATTTLAVPLIAFGNGGFGTIYADEMNFVTLEPGNTLLQRYSASGAMLGQAIDLGAFTANAKIEAVALADGRTALFVYSRAFGGDLFLQLLGRDGALLPVGGQLISEGRIGQNDSLILDEGFGGGSRTFAVQQLTDGTLIVVSKRHVSEQVGELGPNGQVNFKTFSQFEVSRFTTTGEQIGVRYAITPLVDSTEGGDFWPEVIALSGGRFSLAWDRYGADAAEGRGVYATIHKPVILGDQFRNDLRGLSGADRMEGNGAQDTLQGFGGNDTMFGGSGHDDVKGGNGSDIVYGGTGDDMLLGGAGNDLLAGGDGRDTLVFNNVAVRVDLTRSTAQATGEGTDTISGIENVTGNAQGDRIIGSNIGNSLQGRGGADALYGGGGGDALFGGDGNDTLQGGAGGDTLTGGAGSDRFVFATGAGSDVVQDFQNGIDRIVIQSGANSFAGVTVMDSGANTRLTFGGVTVTLTGFDAALIGASDFVFT